MQIEIKKPAKCPCCRSSRITMNALKDMKCQACGYKRLSDTSIQKIQNDNDFQ